MIDFSQLSDEFCIRKENFYVVKKNKLCQKAIGSLRKLENLVSDFSFLSFGRDFIFVKNKSISLQRISTSLELTMGSIVSCCENGCIADANVLLRKYRDDLFFYLYILTYDSMPKDGYDANTLSKMENQIDAWLKNDLKNLNINIILKFIALSPSLIDAVSSYNLKASFDNIGEKLNNYVHGNGYWYYNQNAKAYTHDELASEITSIADHAKYITVVFFFLMALCSPFSAASTDYVDFLDCGYTPPEESQYLVAPFIKNFIRENLVMIDDNCIEYLRKHSIMDI